MNVTQTALDRIDLILHGDLGLQAQPEGSVFRVELQGGGCTGFKYNFDVTNREDDDVDIGEGAVTDSFSIMYLQDSTLDFQNTLFFGLVFPNHPTRKDYYLEAAKFYNLDAPNFNEEEATERLISSDKFSREPSKSLKLNS